MDTEGPPAACFTSVLGVWVQPRVSCSTCVHADEVAYDSTSPGVRLAAVQGLAGLVDNPLAQPLLKAVLPKLGPLLHDTALKVRVALADLLLTVM